MPALAAVPIELHPVGCKKRLIVFQGLDQRGHKSWIETHVVVYEKEEIGPGDRGAAVQSWRQSHGFAQGKPARLEFSRHIRGVVLRAIVDHDDLQGLERLRQ